LAQKRAKTKKEKKRLKRALKKGDYKMAKTYVETVKYQIVVDFEIQGIVDKHDIIGAVFGQSEGLMGEDLDLRELQKSGKIGRIEVETKTHTGKTSGTLTIPSSMDTIKTSLLAAAIETVDKVGPCDSTFKTTKLEDTRTKKRQVVQERAKELLKQLTAGMPESAELTEAIRNDVRTAELQEFGEEKLPCGPDIEKAKEVVVVEGRADVINMLKHGIKNVVAIDGAKIPQSIVDFSKKKKIIAFVDGDRGGDLIARKLSAIATIESIAKAPDGKEVEELMGKEIITSLRKSIPAEDFGKRKVDRPRTSRERTEKPYGKEPKGTGRATVPRAGSYSKPRESGYSRTREGPSSRPRERSYSSPRERPRSGPGSRSYSRPREDTRSGPGSRTYSSPRTSSYSRPRESSYSRLPRRGFGEPSYKPIEMKNDLGEFEPMLKELENSLKARLYGKGKKLSKEVSVRDLLQTMEKAKSVETVVFDGIVTKRLLEQAEKSGVKTLVGIKRGKIEDSEKVKVITAS